MRIAVFTDSFLPYICGATFALINQANALAERGHQICIFCPGGSKRKKHLARSIELHPSIEVVRVPWSLPWGGQPDLNIVIPFWWPTLRRARAFAPDVIHTHTEWSTGWVAQFVGWRLRVPVVGTFHTFWDDERYIRHFPVPNWPVTRRAMGAFSAWYYRRCAVTLAPSKSVQSHMAKRGLSAAIVSNGIPRPTRVDDAQLAAKRTALGLGDRLTFLYLGRISFEKSLTVCLDAFKSVLATHPDARFVLIGGGPDEARIDAHAAALGLGDTVVRTGSVVHEQLMAENLPRIGDIFITASETENQPISVLEAMAFGLPVIGPRARGVPELVEDGVNGRIFAPGDAQELAAHMRELADDPVKRARMAAAAEATARHHFIDHSAVLLEQVYTACLAELGRPVTAVPGSPAADAAPSLRRSA